MKTLTWLLICSIFAGVFNSVHADDEKKKSSSPKIVANYRQSNARKTNTIKNPNAIKSQKQVADKETTAAFNAFRKNCTTLNKSKDYSGIQSAVDEFLSSQSKLTEDMKSMAISYKVSAYMAEKEYQQAIDTAREAMKLKSSNSARHAADAIRAARSMKDFKLGENILEEFNKTGNYGNGALYGAAAELNFDLKNDNAAFEYLKNYGKQPRLGDWDKINILSGYGRYYKNRRKYDVAIAQYKAILGMPKVNANTKDNYELQIAYCLLQWGKKEEATAAFQKLTRSRNGYVRNTANREYKKLTAKPAPPKNQKRKK